MRKVLLTTAALVALTTPALPRDPIWDQLASKIKISSQQMNQVNAIPKNKYDPAGPDAQGILQTAPGRRTEILASFELYEKYESEVKAINAQADQTAPQFPGGTQQVHCRAERTSGKGAVMKRLLLTAALLALPASAHAQPNFKSLPTVRYMCEQLGGIDKLELSIIPGKLSILLDWYAGPKNVDNTQTVKIDDYALKRNRNIRYRPAQWYIATITADGGKTTFTTDKASGGFLGILSWQQKNSDEDISYQCTIVKGA